MIKNGKDITGYKDTENDEKAAKEAIRHQKWLRRIERQIKAQRSATVMI